MSICGPSVLVCVSLRGSCDSVVFSWTDVKSDVLCWMCSGRPAGAAGGRDWTLGRDGRQESGSGFSAPCWTGGSAAHLRAAARAVLQSPAAAALLRADAGRVQARRRLLLRHLLLLSGETGRNQAAGAAVSCWTQTGRSETLS